MADNKASFLWAIKQQESGGDYSSVNSSSGALGAYQVMPSNVSDWTQQALGYSMTPQQYLANPSAQDAVANVILGGYYDQYGASGAAAMWYSGQPDPNKTYGSPSVADYVSQVIGRMSSASPVDSASPATNVPVPGLGSIPIPGNLGGDLASGMETGLVSAFKAIATPLFTWITWIAESALGAVLMALGVYLSIRQTSVVQGVQGKIAEAATVAAPEIAVAKKTKSPKPDLDYVQRTQKRQAESAQRANKPAGYESQDKARVADINKRMKAGRKNG